MADRARIAGSWEELLGRAADFAAVDDPACIPLFDKLLDRLERMTDAQLDAGEGRLRLVRTQAAFGLTDFYFAQGRDEEALAAAQRALALTQPGDPLTDHWRRRIEALLLRLGRGDEAEAERTALAEAADDLDSWGDVAMLQMRRARFDAAAATLDRMEKQAGKAQGKEAGEQRASVATLRSTLALKQQRWAEAVAWHTSAVAFNREEAEAASYIYSELVRSGQPEALTLALDLIARDRDRPIRAGLWRGLALRAQGKGDEARRAFERAAGYPYEKVPFDEQMDWILSNFYLGDPKRRAQAAALGWVDERRHAPFVGLFLAGLGAMVHGDRDAAHLNLGESVRGWQVLGETRRIPHNMWYFAEQLLDAEQQAEIRTYFEDKPL